MTFEEFFKDYMSDEDVWNMSLETYNAHKRRAREIYNENQPMSYNEYLKKQFGWTIDPSDLSEEDDILYSEAYEDYLREFNKEGAR